jgi:hypothetical protein
MSFWVYRKTGGKRQALYLLGVPWEVSLWLLGLVVLLAVSVGRGLDLIP